MKEVKEAEQANSLGIKVGDEGGRLFLHEGTLRNSTRSLTVLLRGSSRLKPSLGELFDFLVFPVVP